MSDELHDELKRKRTALHHAEMRLAGRGISADPYEIMMRDDLLSEVRSLEDRLGQSRTPTAQETRRTYTPSPRYVAPPEPEPVFRERMIGQQVKARQSDIEHQMNLLTIHRRNLAHYRAQSKAYGGVDFAPPVTRHGIQEALAGIRDRKAALAHLGQDIQDLPGDE